jgi:hypothetical protein
MYRGQKHVKKQRSIPRIEVDAEGLRNIKTQRTAHTMTKVSPEYSIYEQNKCSPVYTAQVCVGTTETFFTCVRSVVCVDGTTQWWAQWSNLVWSLSSDGYFYYYHASGNVCFSLTQSSLYQILRFLQLHRCRVITFKSKMSWAFQPFKRRAYIALKCQDPVPNYAIQYPRTESFNGKLLSHTELTIPLLKVMCISNSISGVRTFPIKILNVLVNGWVPALCACIPHI